MSICVIGLNYKTAPVNVREQLYFADDKLTLYLQDVMQRHIAQEAVLLSTCNRSELYCVTEDVNQAREWFLAQTTLPREAIEGAIYIYQDREAVDHIMQVACGLDSMIIGEPQILGQLKQAFSEGCAVGAIETVFHRLFQQVFSVAKEIRSMTAIGACPVSVASTAIRFAKTHVEDFNAATIALVGAGDTTALMMRYLKSVLTSPLVLINRSIDNAVSLLEAEKMDGHVLGLHQLPQALANADVVFTATGSAQPIITDCEAQHILRLRQKSSPLVIMDVAVPRDVAPTVGDLPGIQLYCIDYLKEMIETNRQGREHAGDKAREMIAMRSLEFITSLQTVDHISHTIRAYRGQIEEICQAELVKAKMRLSKGDCPEMVLQLFARSFTNKLLHAPSVQLRQAGKEGRFELLKFAKELFAISDPEVELT